MSLKKFHVYGMGNCLVDVEYEVYDSTLIENNMSKGRMSLIDETTHDLLLKNLLGTKHIKTCGGSAANAIFLLQQLGANTYFSCQIGNDEYGDMFYENMISQGIETNVNPNSRTGTTGKCIILVTEDAERTMNTFLGISATLSFMDVSESAIQQSHFVYIEGYLVANPLGFEAMQVMHEMALKNQVKIALTLSDPNMVAYYKNELKTLLNKGVDILFCNEREALLFTEKNTLSEAQQALIQSAKTFVITLGGKGALVYDGSETTLIKAYDTTVVDTTGAGDIFAGTFLYAITHGNDYKTATRLANLAASKIVAKFGAQLTPKEAFEIKQHIFTLKNE